MKKNNFTNKLKQSLQQESNHIDLRFEKADQILLKEEIVKKKDERSKKKTLSITISEELIDSLESCISELIYKTKNNKLANKSLIIETSLRNFLAKSEDDKITEIEKLL